ncbi:hypothetical protein AJ80_04118 [Polytolypa hystricis UAMH7299]|uniref:Uncharacterized protein n=1 Tax=Polytolypa hystricis (strain UAMH7299) TaxID=1447883 RepID=A0A2B7YDY7_POLH7|nr:hypothetical protein AJ80_04118 [Polytolypa hystricis UAMH7299]
MLSNLVNRNVPEVVLDSDESRDISVLARGEVVVTTAKLLGFELDLKDIGDFTGGDGEEGRAGRDNIFPPIVNGDSKPGRL